jgi:hypothetical protein
MVRQIIFAPLLEQQYSGSTFPMVSVNWMDIDLFFATY